MSTEAQSILKEWSPPLISNAAIFLTGLFYLRGWFSLRRSSHDLFAPLRLASFLAGLFFLWIAIGSPLGAFDEASLTVHMIQHILLMLVIPPLVLLGEPSLPLLHGPPQGFVRTTLGPLLQFQVPASQPRGPQASRLQGTAYPREELPAGWQPRFRRLHAGE